MRIKWLTNISTLTAVVLSLGLSVAIYLGLEKTREPYHLLLQYNAIVRDFQFNIRQSVENYLNKGDAAQLSKAQHRLDEMIAVKITDLPAQLANEVLPLAQELKNFLATGLRASGKLSGAPQALLVHAEREMADNLSLLNDYAQAGRRRNPRSAHLFSAYSARFHELLQQLAHSRQRYFASHDKQQKDYISTLLNDMKSISGKLRALPRLGIFTTVDEDELTLDESSPSREEKSTVYIAELSSLLRRYGAELERTERNIASVKASHEKIYALMMQLDKKLAITTELVNARYNDINRWVTAISVIVILLLISVMVGINIIQRRTIRNFLLVGPRLADYAQGDLRSPITIKTRFTEIQSLQASANALREQLAGLIREIKHKADSVHETSHILTQTSNNMHATSQQQLSQTTQSASAINELTTSIQQIASFTAKAADAATAVDESAIQGYDIIMTTINSINHLVKDVENTAAIIPQLENKSQNIETVLAVIEEIAEQTNLLALNAAIEAARAGEHGRGFAVVADEVRELSRRTSQSTGQIKTIIDDLQNMTSQTVTQMKRSVETGHEASSRTHQAGESLKQIVESVSTIRDQSTMIATAVEQQATAASGINESIHQINELSENTAGTVDTTHGQSNQLARLSESLRQSVEKFRIPD